MGLLLGCPSRRPVQRLIHFVQLRVTSNCVRTAARDPRCRTARSSERRWSPTALLQWPWRKIARGPPLQLPALRSSDLRLREPRRARAGARRTRPLRYDAVVWHTSFLVWLRWTPRRRSSAGVLEARAPARGSCAPCSVALPQDEFLAQRPDQRGARPSSASSTSSRSRPESEWPKIYDGLDRERVGFSRVLTGYLDEDTLAADADAILGDGPASARSTSATAPCPAKPYLGRHAMLKAEIAEVVRERAEARGLRVDISTRAEDTFYGDDWYRFLASCRYTIGDGGRREHPRPRRLGARLRRAAGWPRRPAAGFAELEAACFPGRDGELDAVRDLAAAPRGVRHAHGADPRRGRLRRHPAPGAHYLELRRDLSNLDAVLDVVAERPDHATEMADRAFTRCGGVGPVHVPAAGRGRGARAAESRRPPGAAGSPPGASRRGRRRLAAAHPAGHAGR